MDLALVSLNRNHLSKTIEQSQLLAVNQIEESLAENKKEPKDDEAKAEEPEPVDNTIYRVFTQGTKMM